MSEESTDDPFHVVLDASVVINLKRRLKVAEQWPFLLKLSRLVEAGKVGWPRYVRKELTDARHPDAPGAWLAEHLPSASVVVASDDIVDRMPQKESIATACARLGLQLWSCEELIGWVLSVDLRC